LQNSLERRTIRTDPAQGFLTIDVFFENLQAMGFSVLAALPNLVVDGGAALHLRRDASVDCGAPELAH